MMEKILLEDVDLYTLQDDHVHCQCVCENCGSKSFQVYIGRYLTAIECSVCGTNPTAIHEG